MSSAYCYGEVRIGIVDFFNCFFVFEVKMAKVRVVPMITLMPANIKKEHENSLMV
jgi:hypothetical protein